MSAFPFTLEEISLGETCLTRVTPGDWMMMSSYEEVAEKMYNIELRPDDVWFIGHPKTGTTWASEVIWSVYHNGDTEAMKTTLQHDRWLFPESSSYTKKAFQEKLKDPNLTEEMREHFQRDSYEYAKNQESPRLLKSHLPLSLLPPKLLDTCKVIYLCRNPMDTCVSFYHFSKSVNSKANLEFDMFTELFLAELLPFGPYRQHVKEAWNLRNHPNLYFLTYEDMKKDIRGVVKNLSKFLNSSVSESSIENMVTTLTFENMKNNNMVNMSVAKSAGILKDTSKLMRKGQVGDFTNHLSPEMHKNIQKWWDEEMKETGLKFAGIDKDLM